MKLKLSVLLASVAGLALPIMCEAYIGPGAGITVIGTVIALLGAILLAIVGFVWYPIKRLRANRNKKKEEEEEEQKPQSDAPE